MLPTTKNWLLALLSLSAVACSVDPGDSVDPEALGESEDAIRQLSDWQLAATYTAMPPDGTFPCVDKSDPEGCHSQGMPAGTYTVATQDVSVKAGDLLVLRGQVSAANNISYNIGKAKIWMTCAGAVASPYATKDLSRY